MTSSGSLPASETPGHAIEPPVHRLAILVGVAVMRRPDIQPDVVRAPQQRVQPLQAGEGLFDAADVEVVVFLGQEDDRLGRHRGDEVLVVQAQRQRPGGHCSVSAGSSFSALWRKVVTKQPGAAMVQRGSRPQSQVVMVPPPELPVIPGARCPPPAGSAGSRARGSPSQARHVPTNSPTRNC